MRVTFLLNKKKVEIETGLNRRVIDLLREDFGLTGTKEGCGSGECGACTILVNGESRLSCLMLVTQLDGTEVTTIEGFESDGNMGRLQRAFVRHGGVQCGFCTPGMVLAATDLLARNPEPTRDEIAEGISGNLCRCTGYHKIVDAIEAVATRRDSE
jgi:carbon-monoxide dehydrogenase small subunit